MLKLMGSFLGKQSRPVLETSVNRAGQGSQSVCEFVEQLLP